MMEQLWAPWRMQYVATPQEPGCFFCRATAAEGLEREHLLLFRNERSCVVLNRFPYNNAHLLVFPRAHGGDLRALGAASMAGLGALLQASLGILGEAYQPQGFNLGMNLGSVAGAGVPDHLHWHIVPRWGGDTNFMPVLAEARCIVEHLDATWARLRPLFDALDLP